MSLPPLLTLLILYYRFSLMTDTSWPRLKPEIQSQKLKFDSEEKMTPTFSTARPTSSLLAFCITLAIILAISPVSVALTVTRTHNAVAGGTLVSGNSNCGPRCGAFGVCNSPANNSAILLRWDLSAYPNTTTISATSLTLPISVNGVGVPTMSVFSVSANWTAPTGINENPCIGGTPGTGEPTYEDSSFPSTAWNTTAGQAGPLLLSLTPLNNQIGDAFATHRSSAAFLALVQSWVSDPDTNFGIVVVGPSSPSSSSSVFFGRPSIQISSDREIEPAEPTTPATGPTTTTTPTTGPTAPATGPTTTTTPTTEPTDTPTPSHASSLVYDSEIAAFVAIASIAAIFVI